MNALGVRVEGVVVSSERCKVERDDTILSEPSPRSVGQGLEVNEGDGVSRTLKVTEYCYVTNSGGEYAGCRLGAGGSSGSSGLGC